MARSLTAWLYKDKKEDEEGVANPIYPYYFPDLAPDNAEFTAFSLRFR